MLVIAIIDRYIPSLDMKIIRENMDCKIERTYYKLATIESLKKNKTSVVLHQRLDVGLELGDIEEILALANNIVLIIPEKYRESSFVEELYKKHIYNILFEDDVDSDIIINLLKQRRTEQEAMEYMCIQ